MPDEDATAVMVQTHGPVRSWMRDNEIVLKWVVGPVGVVGVAAAIIFGIFGLINANSEGFASDPTIVSTALSTASASPSPDPWWGPGECPDKPKDLTPPLVVKVYVRSDSSSCWADDLSPVQPGEALDVILVYQNTSEKQQDGASVWIGLTGLTYVPHSAEFYNASTPWATITNDALPINGVNLGSYAPRANFFVRLKVVVPFAQDVPCDARELSLVGGGRFDGLDHWVMSEQALVTVDRAAVC